jgi:hypothetical protein
VLGAEVRVRVEVLGLLEHVLGPGAPVEAGGGDRADEVKALDLRRLGEFDRVARAFDVRRLRRLGARPEVVHRAEVEHVLDPAQAREVGLRHSQARQRQVARDRHGALGRHAPAPAQRLGLRQRALAHEEIHARALSLEELLREPRADEAGRAGDEVAHGGRSLEIRLI